MQKDLMDGVAASITHLSHAVKLAALAELHSHFPGNFLSPFVLVFLVKLGLLLKLATVERVIKREADFLKCMISELVFRTKTEAFLLAKMNQTHR